MTAEYFQGVQDTLFYVALGGVSLLAGLAVYALRGINQADGLNIFGELRASDIENSREEDESDLVANLNSLEDVE